MMSSMHTIREISLDVYLIAAPPNIYFNYTNNNNLSVQN